MATTVKSSSVLLFSSLSLSLAGPSFYKYAPIPTARYGAVGGIMYDKYNSPEVWVVGGSNKPNEIDQQVGGSLEIYSANWDEWKSGSSLLTSRIEHGGAPLNGVLYVGGGLISCDSSSTTSLCTTNTVEMYSTTTSTWTSGPSLLTSRSGHFFASDESTGLLYSIGGVDSAGNYLSSVEVFSVQTNQWTEIQPMTIARTGHNAAVMNSKLYVVGGCGEVTPVSQCQPLTSVEVYDPQVNQWTMLKSLSTPRHSFTLGIYDSQLIIAGGSSSVGMNENGEEVVKTIDIYDAVANEWYLVTRMNDARNGLVKGYNLFVGISMFLISGISEKNAYENTNEMMALMCFTEKEVKSLNTSEGGSEGVWKHPICDE